MEASATYPGSIEAVGMDERSRVAVVVLTPPFPSVAVKSLRLLRILRVIPLARLGAGDAERVLA